MWIENALLKLALYTCAYITVQNPDQGKTLNYNVVPKDIGHKQNCGAQPALS